MVQTRVSREESRKQSRFFVHSCIGLCDLLSQLLTLTATLSRLLHLLSFTYALRRYLQPLRWLAVASPSSLQLCLSRHGRCR